MRDGEVGAKIDLQRARTEGLAATLARISGMAVPAAERARMRAAILEARKVEAQGKP